MAGISEARRWPGHRRRRRENRKGRVEMVNAVAVGGSERETSSVKRENDTAAGDCHGRRRGVKMGADGSLSRYSVRRRVASSPGQTRRGPTWDRKIGAAAAGHLGQRPARRSSRRALRMRAQARRQPIRSSSAFSTVSRSTSRSGRDTAKAAGRAACTRARRRLSPFRIG